MTEASISQRHKITCPLSYPAQQPIPRPEVEWVTQSLDSRKAMHIPHFESGLGTSCDNMRPSCNRGTLTVHDCITGIHKERTLPMADARVLTFVIFFKWKRVQSRERLHRPYFPASINDSGGTPLQQASWHLIDAHQADFSSVNSYIPQQELHMGSRDLSAF